MWGSPMFGTGGGDPAAHALAPPQPSVACSLPTDTVVWHVAACVWAPSPRARRGTPYTRFKTCWSVARPCDHSYARPPCVCSDHQRANIRYGGIHTLSI